jgi:outer membrane protein assembly factor BamB
MVQALFVTLAAAEDWPDFRGPRGDGHSTETRLPLNWSERQNVRWKVDVPGKGWSSPIVSNGEIWLTAATDGDRSLRVLAFNAADGKLLRNVEVFRMAEAAKGHQKNSGASPSVVVEGDRVYAHFGGYGTACVRRDGTVLWRNQEVNFWQVHGPGGSPVLFENTLLFSADGNDTQSFVALDKNSGKVAWRKSRPSGMAYSTPLVVRTTEGPQVVSTGAHKAYAYDPRTGRELWWVSYGDGFSNVPRPVFAHGLVYLTTGFNQPSLLAVRVDGRGDVTSSHVSWRMSRGAPHTPSPVIVGDVLYMVSDAGIITCVDAKTGKEQWKQRLPGTYSASPVVSEDKIYFLNEDGETTVIAAQGPFRKLASNSLEGEFLASMAVADGALYFRSATSLYRIGESRVGLTRPTRNSMSVRKGLRSE